MPRIFLSYRRSDAASHAGLLYEQLVDHFGEHHVFRDVDAITPGQDFRERLDRELASTAAVVAVIGESWVSATDASTGERRLDDPNDYVRYEIAKALERKVHIIPVTLNGAAPPRADELPTELRALATLNVVELTDRYWKYGVMQLLEILETTVGRPEQRVEDDAIRSAAVAEADRIAYAERKNLRGFLATWDIDLAEDGKTRDLLEDAMKGEAPLVALEASKSGSWGTEDGVLVATTRKLCFVGQKGLFSGGRQVLETHYDQIAKLSAEASEYKGEYEGTSLSVETFAKANAREYWTDAPLDSVRAVLDVVHTRTPDGTVEREVAVDAYGD